MIRKSRSLVAILGLTLSLFATACTGDDDSADVFPTSSVAGDSATADSDSSEPALQADVGSGPAGSISELELRWEAARAAVAETLGAETYERDGTQLVGPGDFSLDLSGCPQDWSDEMVVGSPVTIAHIGDADDYGLVAQGMGAYFDHVNRSGGINGRQIDLVVVDDQRVPTKTIEAVEDLLNGPPPLAVTTFGTSSSQATFDELNNQCIPQPFVGSSHQAWGDPVNHPWTTGFQMAYSTETILWGGWIKRNLGVDLPVTVGALTADSDYGRAYLAAFSDWAAENRDVVAEVITATHQVDEADMESAVSDLAAAAPQVVLVMTAGEACSAALEAIDGSTMADGIVAVIVPDACTDPVRHLLPAGRAADGVLSAASPFKASNDPQYAEDPYIEFVNQLLESAGVEHENGQAGIGAGQYGWAYVEAMRIAAELDGGLSRSNFLLALRSLSLRHPMLLDGISFATSGVDDAYLVEGGRMQRYSAGTSSWEPETLVVDLDGATPNCFWNGQICS